MMTSLKRSTRFPTGLLIPFTVLAMGAVMFPGCKSPSGEAGVGTADEPALSVTSPDGHLAVQFQLTAAGAPRYSLSVEGTPVLLESKLGLVREDADFTTGLELRSVSKPELVEDNYEILTAKRRVNHYRARQKIFHLATSGGESMDVIFQVSNDGIAFRYHFPETSTDIHRVTKEVSSFHFSPQSRAWLQPMSVAKSGWERTNPSYEEYYQMDIPVGTRSTLGAGWVYPGLFRTRDTWILITETGLGRGYCGTRLSPESPDGEYTVTFPDPRESYLGGSVNPESALPWTTPWRVIAVGSLKTIAESTLGVDLALLPTQAADESIEPGKASWSWPLLGDDKTVFEVQKEFIDYAAEMKWHYCLIDAQWDQQIGYERIKELVDYGRGKHVRILLWYNSRGDWNGAPQTPRDRLLTHESRVQEFDRLKEMGVAGLKVDFFGGDGQSMMEYYQDILEDAAPYGFLMNFHGCTLPRGWQRTYPHLMTMEAIRGLEFVTFEQANADQEPTHATMLPFTRNVFDPMDFTPMVLDHINRIQRRTSSAFELALSVLFISGIQHYAEIPEGMAKAPKYVREFLKEVPAVWDDVQFLDGYPGRYVVIARKGGGNWYVCGINGKSESLELSLNLSGLTGAASGQLITDGEGGNLSFRQESIRLGADKVLSLTVRPRGGFVLLLD